MEVANENATPPATDGCQKRPLGARRFFGRGPCLRRHAWAPSGECGQGPHRRPSSKHHPSRGLLVSVWISEPRRKNKIHRKKEEIYNSVIDRMGHI